MTTFPTIGADALVTATGGCCCDGSAGGQMQQQQQAPAQEQAPPQQAAPASGGGGMGNIGSMISSFLPQIMSMVGGGQK